MAQPETGLSLRPFSFVRNKDFLKFRMAEMSCGSKISSKLLYLAWFSRYKHFCVLQFLQKIRKFKMAAILGETNFFLKIRMATLQSYPVGQIFVVIYLVLFSRYKHFCVMQFLRKIQNGRHFG